MSKESAEFIRQVEAVLDSPDPSQEPLAMWLRRAIEKYRLAEDALSLRRLERDDALADLNKADCCSGFVTQEGRDIHQAIEHEPQNPDFCVRCGAPYAPYGSCSKRNDRERPCQGGRGENAAVRTLQKP